MSKSSKRINIVMPTVEEDLAINAAAKAESRKQLVSIRYSPEVLAYFKATGDGWQSRMDGVLKEYIAKRIRRAPSGA